MTVKWLAILFYQVMGPDRLACVNNAELNAPLERTQSDNLDFSINACWFKFSKIVIFYVYTGYFLIECRYLRGRILGPF